MLLYGLNRFAFTRGFADVHRDEVAGLDVASDLDPVAVVASQGHFDQVEMAAATTGT